MPDNTSVFKVKQGNRIIVDTNVYKRNGFSNDIHFDFRADNPTGLNIDLTPDDSSGSSNLTVRTIIDVDSNAPLGVREITLTGTPEPLGEIKFSVEVLAADAVIPDNNPITLDFVANELNTGVVASGLVTVRASTTSGSISSYEWSTTDSDRPTIGSYDNIPENQKFVTSSEMIPVVARDSDSRGHIQDPKINLTLTARTTTGLFKTITKEVHLPPTTASDNANYSNDSNIWVTGPTITARGGWFDAQGVKGLGGSYQFEVEVQQWLPGSTPSGWVGNRSGEISIESVHGPNDGISFDITPSKFNLYDNGPKQLVTISNIKYNQNIDSEFMKGFPAIGIALTGTRQGKKLRGSILMLTNKDADKSVITSEFRYLQPTGQPTTVYSFAATASTSIGVISKYSWNFGDGSTGEGQDITHNYSSSGNYTVVLTVTDSTGNSKSVSNEIQVVTGSVQMALSGPNMYKHPQDLNHIYKVYGLPEGSTYSFQLRGINWNNKSSFTAQVYGSSSMSSMTISPTNVTVNQNGSVTITLSNIRYDEYSVGTDGPNYASPALGVHLYTSDTSVKVAELWIYRNPAPFVGYGHNNPGIPAFN